MTSTYDPTVTNENRTLHAVLQQAHALGFFEDHDGHDFQPDDMFEWSAETAQWWQTWTGNPAVGVPPFRVFGRDGAGGLAAFWLCVPDAAVEAQPIVFLGSEGELSVIARNVGDYLWLLANGVGPLETVDGLHRVPEPIPVMVELAQQHTGIPARSVEAVRSAADAELAALTALIESNCV